MTSRRLTRVQQDVVDRLRDGWVMTSFGATGFELRKPGEAPRFVNSKTAWSLFERHLIKISDGWVLA